MKTHSTSTVFIFWRFRVKGYFVYLLIPAKWRKMGKIKITTCCILFAVYFVLCISTLFWTVFLNGFVRCFEKLFDVYMKLLLICYLSVGGTSVRFRPHWFLNCGVLWNLVFGFLGRSEAKECPSCEQEVHSFSQQWKMLPVSTMPNI